MDTNFKNSVLYKIIFSLKFCSSKLGVSVIQIIMVQVNDTIKTFKKGEFKDINKLHLSLQKIIPLLPIYIN